MGWRGGGSKQTPFWLAILLVQFRIMLYPLINHLFSLTPQFFSTADLTDVVPTHQCTSVIFELIHGL